VAATATDEKARLGAVVAGRYRLERVLGRGGMGIVYEAETLQGPRRRVAIKIMHPESQLNEENVKRFKNEGANAGRVKHPNIVEFIEAGQDGDGSLFIVLELLRGTDLSSYLVRYKKMEPRDAIVVTAQVLQALAVAHKEEIVHRDIKPENIFLTKGTQGDAHVKIVDFGISKAINPEKAFMGSITQINTTVGTPHYMSPEQARGESIDARADLWALGVVLYESLTEHLPFDGDNFNSQIVAVVTEPHLPATTYGVDRGLSDIIDRCLQKDRKLRFSDAREMLDEMREYVAEHPELGLSDSALFEVQNTQEWRVPEMRKGRSGNARVSGEGDAAEAAPVFPGMVRFEEEAAADSAPTKLRALDRSLVRPTPQADREPAAPAPITLDEPAPASPHPAVLVLLAILTAIITGSATYVAYQRLRPPAVSPDVRLTFVNLPEGAQLRVNGDLRGPAQNLRMPRRLRTVTLTVERPGYQPLQFPVTLDQDQNISLPALVPVPTAPPPRPTPPAVVAAPDAAVDAPPADVRVVAAPPVAPAAVAARIPIASGPPTPNTFLKVGGQGCMVVVDGTTISAAPVMNHPVAAGRHRIDCVRPRGRWYQVVDVIAGQTTQVRF
jgi:serine/threonine protein kinase